MGVKVQSHPHPFAPLSISSSQKLGSSVCLYHPFTRLLETKRRLTLPKGCAVIRKCRARFDQFSDYHHEDDHKNAVFLKIFENSRYNEEEDDDDRSRSRSSNMGFSNSASFSSSELGSLRPSWLEIWPEPTNWPGRDEIIQASIERKAVRFDIPVSLRMIKNKRKQLLELELEDHGTVPVTATNDGEDSVYCSVKKAFSSMVFIVRELQSYNFTLQKKEIIYCRCQDLQRSLSRIHKESHASFVWLFQQVFSKTPTLMLYLMILLANFTVYSLMDDTEIAAPAPPTIPSISSIITSESSTLSVTENHPSLPQPSFDSLVFLVNTSSATSNLVADDEPTQTDMEEEEEEEKLWKSVVEEASRMAEEALLDHETIHRMISPVLGVEVEADDYTEYHRTDLQYQKRISEDPKNPLLLCNYGQFLSLFARDQDR